MKLSKYFFSKEQLLLPIGVFLILAAGMINIRNSRPSLVLSKQDTALNINQNFLLYFSAGNKRLITDLLWVQTLIESDVEHYQKRDLSNWMFLRFNTISVLDPKFYENYLYGGQFLAIVKDDLEGASVIYDKGLQAYPNDYSLNYNAGFLNYYEMGDHEKGLKYLSRIEHHPKAPIFVTSIINKLRLETGMDLKDVLIMVKHNYDNTQDENLKAKLKKDLYAIKAEIDLTCLNSGGANCDLRDMDGNPYVHVNNEYRTLKPFLLYRINKRKGDDDSSPSQGKPVYRN